MLYECPGFQGACFGASKTTCSNLIFKRFYILLQCYKFSHFVILLFFLGCRCRFVHRSVRRHSSQSVVRAKTRGQNYATVSSEASSSRPNKNRKVSLDQKAHMMWQVEVAGLPIQVVFHGFAKKLYYKWKNEEERERVNSGPPRLMSIETIEEICDKLKSGAYDSIQTAAISYGVSRQTLDRELKERRRERGLKRLSRKKPAKRRTVLTHGPPFSLLLRVVPIQTRTPACPWHFPIERRRSPESPDAECISRNGCLLCLGACIKAGVEKIILPKAKTQRDVIDSSDDDFAIGQQASS